MTALYIGAGVLVAAIATVTYLLMAASSHSSRAEARADEILRKRQ